MFLNFFCFAMAFDWPGPQPKSAFEILERLFMFVTQSPRTIFIALAVSVVLTTITELVGEGLRHFCAK